MRELKKVGKSLSDTIADGRLRYYSVHYQASPALIRGTVRHPLSATEMTEACEMLLEHAQRHDCPYWLLDGRADSPGRPTDVYEWMKDEFLPVCIARWAAFPAWHLLRRPRFGKSCEPATTRRPPPPCYQPRTARAGL